MRVIGILAVLGLAAAGAVPAANMAATWQMYQPTASRCWAQMPGVPQSDSTHPQIWASVGDGGQTYSLGFEDEPAQGPAGQALLTSASDLVVQNKQGKLLERNFYQWYGYAACDFKVAQGAGQTAQLRLILAKRRLYTLESDGAAASYDPASAQKFFASFHLLRPYANRGKP